MLNLCILRLGSWLVNNNNKKWNKWRQTTAMMMILLLCHTNTISSNDDNNNRLRKVYLVFSRCGAPFCYSAPLGSYNFVYLDQSWRRQNWSKRCGHWPMTSLARVPEQSWWRCRDVPVGDIYMSISTLLLSTVMFHTTCNSTDQFRQKTFIALILVLLSNFLIFATGQGNVRTWFIKKVACNLKQCSMLSRDEAMTTEW